MASRPQKPKRAKFQTAARDAHNRKSILLAHYILRYRNQGYTYSEIARLIPEHHAEETGCTAISNTRVSRIERNYLEDLVTQDRRSATQRKARAIQRYEYLIRELYTKLNAAEFGETRETNEATQGDKNATAQKKTVIKRPYDVAIYREIRACLQAIDAIEGNVDQSLATPQENITFVLDAAGGHRVIDDVTADEITADNATAEDATAEDATAEDATAEDATAEDATGADDANPVLLHYPEQPLKPPTPPNPSWKIL